MTFRSFSYPYRPCHNIEQIFSRCRIVLWPKASSRIRGLPIFLRPDGLRRLPWKSRPTGWYILTPVAYPYSKRRTLAPSSPHSSRQPTLFPDGLPSCQMDYAWLRGGLSLLRTATSPPSTPHSAQRSAFLPGGLRLFQSPLHPKKFSLVTPTAPCHPQATLVPPQIPYAKNLDSR